MYAYGMALFQANLLLRVLLKGKQCRFDRMIAYGESYCRRKNAAAA